MGESEGILRGGLSYNGIPFTDIIAKYWELFNGEIGRASCRERGCQYV